MVTPSIRWHRTPPLITPTSGTFVQNNATVNFDAPLTSLAGDLYITGGTTNLGTNNVNLAKVNLISGTLTGTGTLTVTGSMIWDGGTMAGTGPDHRLAPSTA